MPTFDAVLLCTVDVITLPVDPKLDFSVSTRLPVDISVLLIFFGVYYCSVLLDIM